MSTQDAPGDPTQKPRNGQAGARKSPGETGKVKRPDREGGQRKTDREARLAAALRANLRRRKAPQVRGRPSPAIAGSSQLQIQQASAGDGRAEEE